MGLNILLTCEATVFEHEIHTLLGLTIRVADSGGCETRSAIAIPTLLSNLCVPIAQASCGWQRSFSPGMERRHLATPHEGSKVAEEMNAVLKLSAPLWRAYSWISE